MDTLIFLTYRWKVASLRRILAFIVESGLEVNAPALFSTKITSGESYLEIAALNPLAPLAAEEDWDPQLIQCFLGPQKGASPN